MQAAAAKVFFFLIAFSSNGGGHTSPFTLTRLAAFADSAACEQAAKTVKSAMSPAEKDVGGRVEVGCIRSDKVAAMFVN